MVAVAGREDSLEDDSCGVCQLWACGMKGRAIRVGVIGCGYWGPNLVRNFARHPGSEVQAVCDRQFERATRVGAEYRIPTITDRPEEVIKAPDIDLVVIATPSFSHYHLAQHAIATRSMSGALRSEDHPSA